MTSPEELRDIVYLLPEMARRWKMTSYDTQELVKSLTPYQSDFMLLVNEIRHNYLGLVGMPLPNLQTDVFECAVEDTVQQLESIDNEARFF